MLGCDHAEVVFGEYCLVWIERRQLGEKKRGTLSWWTPQHFLDIIVRKGKPW